MVSHSALRFSLRISIFVAFFWSLASPVIAEPTITARLAKGSLGTSMRGQLKFDLGGGPAVGEADLSVAADPDQPPLLQNGGKTFGRFQVHIELEGTYPGGSFGTVQGIARISGSFTDAKKAQAKLFGLGKFKANLSGPVGAVEAQCDWDGIEMDGAGLTSPQPFSATLPFTFEPTNEIPKLRDSSNPQPEPKEPVLGVSQQDSSSPQPQVKDPVSEAPRWLWVGIAGGVVLVAGIAIIGRKVLIAKREKS